MATQLVRITSDVEIPYLTYSGQPVLTFALIDKVHGRVEGTAKRNFSTNRKRFIEGEDFFYVTDSQSLDEIRTSHSDVLKDAAREITLLTESGYLMLVKSFTDDLSWQIQRQLVKLYFRVKAAVEQPAPQVAPVAYISGAEESELSHRIWRLARPFYMEGSIKHWLYQYVNALAGVHRRQFIPVSQFPEVLAMLSSIEAQVAVYRTERIRHEKEWLLLTLKRELDKRLGRAGPEFEMLTAPTSDLTA